MPDMNTCIGEKDVLLVVAATQSLNKLD